MAPHRTKDHLGRDVAIPEQPLRIVSLCPSQTETLFALGLGARIAGRTRYCIHPQEEIVRVPHVDGTKRPDLERLRSLSPDLVIAEKEENTKETVEAIAREFPVYVTDVVDVASALRMVRDLGHVTGLAARGESLAEEIERALRRLRPLSRPVSAAYLIWRKPWMGAGAGTYIDSVLELCGMRNALAALPGRYPELDGQALRAACPEAVLLSSEPYPFSEKHVEEIRAILPAARILLVDGEIFSWYGARMLKLPDALDPLLRDLER